MQEQQEQPEKETPVCPHFQRGKCYFGDACKFSHRGDGAVVEKPANFGQKPPPVKPCPYFKDGKCFFADKCKYSHAGFAFSFSPVMAPSLPPMPGHYEIPPSPFYPYAIYPYGPMGGPVGPSPAHLPSMPMHHPLPHHPRPQPPPHANEEKNLRPCRFWAEGSCQYGDRCKFTHYGQAGSSAPQGVQAGVKRSAGNDDINDQMKRRRVDPPSGIPGSVPMYNSQGGYSVMSHPSSHSTIPSQHSPVSTQVYNPYLLSAASLYGQ